MSTPTFDDRAPATSVLIESRPAPWQRVSLFATSVPELPIRHAGVRIRQDGCTQEWHAALVGAWVPEDSDDGA